MFIAMLKDIIRDRKDVRCWYDALPAGDFRKEKNKKYHKFGETMGEVLAILMRKCEAGW